MVTLPDGSSRKFLDLMTHTKSILEDANDCRRRAFEAYYVMLEVNCV